MGEGEEEVSGDAVAEGSGTMKPYSAPRLVILGRLRDLTLGGSPGVFDSGDMSANTQPRSA